MVRLVRLVRFKQGGRLQMKYCTATTFNRFPDQESIIPFLGNEQASLMQTLVESLTAHGKAPPGIPGHALGDVV